MIGEFTFVFFFSITISLVTYFVTRWVLQRPDNLIRRAADKLWSNGGRRVADVIFVMSAILCVLGLSTFALLRYNNFESGGLDLAEFDQVIWNSLHGRLFESAVLAQQWQITHGVTIQPVQNVEGTLPLAHKLGDHFAPLLLALVPVYVLLSDPRALKLVQPFALVGMAFPLYWFARPRVGHFLALVTTIAFFISPILPGIIGYDFHENVLATLPLALALFFLFKRRDVPFLTCALLTLLAKEDMGLIVAEFGLFILLFQRRYRFGLSVFALGLVWVVGVVQFVKPYFAPTDAGTWLGHLYPAFGSSFSEMIQTVVTRPLVFLQYILEPPRIAFVLHLFVPLACISLVGPEVAALLILPLLESVLGGFEWMYRPFTWYTATMLPFIFFAAILGAQRILNWRAADWSDRATQPFVRKLSLGILILSASFLTYYLYSPLPFTRNFRLNDVLPSVHSALGHDLLRQIPPEGVLSVPDDIMPYVSQRKSLYVFPLFRDYRQIDYLFADTTRFWYNFHRDSWVDVLGTGYFEILSNQDGYILAKRRPLEHLTQIRFDDQIALLGYTVPLTGTLQGGQTLHPIAGWRAEQNIAKPYVVSVRLLDQAGHIWAQDEREPQEGSLPTNRWTPSQFVGDQYALPLPVTMPPGDYQIVIAVFDPESNRNLIARNATGRALGETIVLDTVRIEKNKSSITASDLQRQFQLEQPFFVDMREIRLIGFKPLPQTMAVGATLPVGIYWRAREKPRGDYVVAVQLRDAAELIVVEQKDRPAAGAYPTTHWVEGEVLLDWHDVVVPAALAPGEYAVQVVLSDASGRVLGEAALAKISVVGR